MHTFKRIAALTASFLIGAVSFVSCGSSESTTDVIDIPIITVTITEPATETTVTETEALTEEETAPETTGENESGEETVTENIDETEPDAEEESPAEEATDEEVTEAASEEGYPVVDDSYVVYHFRTKKQLNEHFEKHGAEFDGDFDYRTAEDYETGASDVINNDDALFKYEQEDGDGVYYIEATNEFVILSTDGYIRTYFRPSSGKKYFDKQ